VSSSSHLLITSKTGLLENLETSLGSNITTEKTLLTIEVLDDFLERSVSGLDVEEVDDHKLETEPAIVDDVVFPVELVESDGVDVGVEEESEIDSEEENCETLCTNLVWQDLNTVTDQKTRPRAVVEDVVQEDEEDLGLSGGNDSSLDELSGADGPGTEGDKHTTGREQEQWATTEFVDEETHGESNDEVDDVEDTVDLESGLSALDTGSSEDVVHVVRDKTVTRPLGEETEGDKNDETVTVTLCLEEFDPSVTLEFLLELDSVTNFTVLDLNELVVFISSGVCIGEDLESLLIFAFGDEETWGFWDKPDSNELDDRWRSLNH